MTETALPEVALTRIDGTDDNLANHRGNVLLIVNTASQCGLTPQYAGLEELHRKYSDRGFEVLAFPANDFGSQEPGSDGQVAQFCEVNYQTSFPLFAKGSVVGEGKQPLFAALVKAAPKKRGEVDAFRERLRGHGMVANEDPEILWNFEKFLVNRDGTVAARFAPAVTPEDPELVQAVEQALDAPSA